MKKETTKRRGVCRVFEDDSVEFTPYGEGNAIQKDIKKVRKSTLYETEGEQSNYIMHLKVDKKSTDPIAELADDFEKLLKNLAPDREPPMRGRVLLNTEKARVTLNKPQKKIEIRITLSLDPSVSYKDDLVQRNFEVMQCFTNNKTIIQNAMK